MDIERKTGQGFLAWGAFYDQTIYFCAPYGEFREECVERACGIADFNWAELAGAEEILHGNVENTDCCF